MEPYLAFSFQLVPVLPWRDLLIADLGTIGFEAFEETEKGFEGYIQQSMLNEKKLQETIGTYEKQSTIVYQHRKIEPINWNAKWEEEFEPVFVDERCVIKAPFHKIEEHFEYTITLHPKMAFGTGHHQTTYLMIRAMLSLDMEGKSVLDMGCGTGVLAIMAAMKKAGSVKAIDNDGWAYNNCLENILLNEVGEIIVEKGDASLLEGSSFNIILANINKNVLLADMGRYASCLTSGGNLLISGFFEDDIQDLIAIAHANDLEKSQVAVLGKWATIQFLKKG